MRNLIILAVLISSCSPQGEKSEITRIALAIEKRDSSVIPARETTYMEVPDQESAGVDSAEVEAVNIKYDSLKKAIAAKRQSLASSYNAATSDSAGNIIINKARKYLLQTLTHDLFPLWYGTVWDFNGITETPLKGEIACGYFISTTLKHSGFKLQRYKLAQQGATNIVRTLCSSSIMRIGNNDTDWMFGYVNQQGKGLYIVGLDYHVGFIHNSEEGIFFIHSNYLEPLVVMSEKAAESEALQMTDNYVIGNLLANDSLIEKWFSGGSIPTVTD